MQEVPGSHRAGHIPTITLLLGECSVRMHALEDVVHVVVCDPPYG